MKDDWCDNTPELLIERSIQLLAVQPDRQASTEALQSRNQYKDDKLHGQEQEAERAHDEVASPELPHAFHSFEGGLNLRPFGTVAGAEWQV
jgi:hypothetical protein